MELRDGDGFDDDDRSTDFFTGASKVKIDLADMNMYHGGAGLTDPLAAKWSV
jgi:hypothetical protein